MQRKRTQQQEAEYQRALAEAAGFKPGASTRPPRPSWGAPWIREGREHRIIVGALAVIDWYLVVWALHQLGHG